MSMYTAARMASGTYTTPWIQTTRWVDGADHAPIWSFGCTAAVIPPMKASALAFKVLCVGQCHHESGEGVEPDGMQRPPSTPSMG